MDKKLLRWNFIFQYGWVLTNIFNSILLTPLYLKNIDVNTLGIWWATGAVLGWMTLVDPGVGEVLQQRIAELRGRNENEEVGKLIGSGYLASAFVLAISILLGLGCYFFIGKIINKNISDFPYLSTALWMSVLATGLSLVSFTMSGINQGLHNSAQVAISSLTANCLFLVVNLLFLFLGYGVLSIAIANLIRALYINVHNIASMFKVMKKQALKMVLQFTHFKKFIRIFSFTSSSKIITGLSYSIDMIVLARFISPALITMYEVNRRPIGHFYSLISRHTVALMPLISHAKGKGEKDAILTLMNQQFRFYSYAALFVAIVFCFNYANLIAAWTSPGQYVGNTILYLLVGQFFFALLSSFMANVGYALGDIKIPSLYSIVRGILFGTAMFFTAKYFGITGAVITSLVFSATVDFIFYYYRVYKLGYLQISLLTNLANRWVFILPAAALGGWGITQLVNALLPATMYFAKLLVNGGIFTLFFLVLLLLVDVPLRTKAKILSGKFITLPFFKLKRA
ncbi:MAG TPA: hypothetical protein VEY10_12805 [Flavisolibacter sp.]|nr:hypothetical protein [Flavisolibacter sp.]